MQTDGKFLISNFEINSFEDSLISAKLSLSFNSLERALNIGGVLFLDVKSKTFCFLTSVDIKFK